MEVHFDHIELYPLFMYSWGGESVSIEVEVVNAPLDYNILMGRNWIYAMKTVVLSVFRVVSFPHKGES